MSMITNLNDLVFSQGVVTGAINPLPLCHTTKETNLGKIMKNHLLECSKLCPVYKEKTIFFFYGKAKYMPTEDVANEYRFYSPITILYQLQHIDNQSPKRVFPFDAGGHERYELEVPLEDFAIENPTEPNLLELIKKLFHTNENYLGKLLKIKADSYPLCYALKELHRLYSAASTAIRTRYGEQAFTVEVQFEQSQLPFKPYAIVLPHDVFTKFTPAAIKENFGDLILYPYGDGTTIDILKKYMLMQDRVQEVIAASREKGGKRVA